MMETNFREYNSFEPVYELVIVKLPDGTIQQRYKIVWKEKQNNTNKYRIVMN